MPLSNKTALVTGAASGIGMAIAQDLAAAGARIALVDRDADGLTRVRETLESAGKNADAHGEYAVDLADPVAILQLRDSVTADMGLPDVIVNAAGFDRIEPFLKNDDDLWVNLVNVNYLGPVRLCHAFLSTIVEAGSNTKIINIASDAGRVGSTGETVYSGTKGALIAFTKSLAREMARHQITVNCVCPGPTDTPLFAQVPSKLRDSLQATIPLRRLAQPADIAAAVRYFASDGADYVTGQTLSVSGGLTMAG